MKICNESRHIKQTLHTTSLSPFGQKIVLVVSDHPFVENFGTDNSFYSLNGNPLSRYMLVYYNMKLRISLLCLLYICISLYNVQLVFVMNIHKILLDAKKQKTNQTKNVCRHSITNWKSSSYVIF